MFTADEFVSLARGPGDEAGQQLSEPELRDVEALMKIITTSTGKVHRPAELAGCECRSCALRRLGGLSGPEALEVSPTCCTVGLTCAKASTLGLSCVSSGN